MKTKDKPAENVDRSEKPNLLIYAHYYHPDVASTGQILKELAEGMTTKFSITVICVVPSYGGKVDSQYKSQKYYFENINGIKVIRVRVPEFSKTNKISRIRNILTYFFRALIATTKAGKQDYVFSISQPPILGGLLGVCGKWMKKAKYIYNIQDFNPEQIMAVGYSKNKVLLHFMLWLDKFSCKRASSVIVVGRDMMETLSNRFKGQCPNHTVINNWINEKIIHPLPEDDQHVASFKKKYGLLGKYVIMYSGNLGLYYDLENIMKVIIKFKGRTDIIFAFVGAGSIKNRLVAYKEKNNLNNVVFIPYQAKADLIYSLNAGDIHWCVSAAGIKGVSVPSKLYGIMAVGKPVLAVLEEGSEARFIIEETQCGLVTQPGNYQEIEKMIQKVINDRDKYKLVGKLGRQYLIQHLTKDHSIQKYINEVMSC
ncbi:glycosyltransferase family 4 protein [Sporolactobacillus kofuensis]|uniref:Glycosyltransferase family 4 protein n=1 Tax=Sporolactobacillus kofuensis TaxID=269672 RepID=A0ABW1WHJ7_9BACL|nr:glycosyltransferase family 4 protein [Sporolactobacillus kofuensis]MCO7177093.1 glycosyltransferase family 4 protein [Sporolactobacillus kofuensis]